MKHHVVAAVVRRQPTAPRNSLPGSFSRALKSAATAFAFVLAPLPLPAAAQPFALESWSIDGGGGTSAGGGFSLTGTIGQPDAGVLSGGGFTLVGGLPGFHVVPAGPVTLTIQLLPDGRVQVSWPGDGEGWRLQAATRVGATADWQAVTVPGTTSFADTPNRAMQFFRLVRP